MASSDSWRVQVNEIDRSRTVGSAVGSIGACVIRAPKGVAKPTLIYQGSEQRILDIFGYPSSSYPDIWEAIQFNNERSLWISAPYDNISVLYGGVLVTKTGTIALKTGILDPSTFDVTAINTIEQIGVGDGATVLFNYTTTFGVGKYVNQSIGLTINHNGTDEIVDLTPTDADPEVLAGTITGGAAGTVSGTFARTTGVMSLTFSNAPLTTDTLSINYDSDYSSDTYFTLLSSSPREDDEAVLVTYDTGSSLFTINLYIKNNKGTWRKVTDYKVSITPNTYDGFGANVYITEILSDNDYLIPIDSSLAYSTFTNDTANVEFGGGTRGFTITITDLTTGWDFYKQKNTYTADIFMDFSADPGIPALFDTLRSSYQKYKSYILPLPIETSSTSIITKSGYSINNRGLSFCWNWGRVRDTYNNSSFWTSLVGRVGIKFAQMDNIFNGLAPSWIDENNHGGQLGGGIIELKYDPSETELEALDTAGINPIIFDPSYGVMIVSQRTAQSPSLLSDSSWIAHSRLFDYIISNTITQILTYQITKLNDEIHRQIASSLGQTLISPIVSLGLLSEAIPKCNRDNNTDSVLARREFVFTWGVKVTPFSEKIVFNFVNVGQTIKVEEVI